MAPMAMATASAADRLDALTGDVDNLRKSESATGSEVEEIKKAMVVAVPQASATPATIGQHVGALEADLAATQKSISDNLGVNIHGLVDAGYEHNFNQPNFEYNYTRAWDENGFQLTQGNLHIEKDGTVGFVTNLTSGRSPTQSRTARTTRSSMAARERTRRAVVRRDPILFDLYRADRFRTQHRGGAVRNAARRGNNPHLPEPELQRGPWIAVYPGRAADPYRDPRVLHG